MRGKLGTRFASYTGALQQASLQQQWQNHPEIKRRKYTTPSQETFRSFYKDNKTAREYWLLDGLCWLLEGKSYKEVAALYPSSPSNNGTSADGLSNHGVKEIHLVYSSTRTVAALFPLATQEIWCFASNFYESLRHPIYLDTLKRGIKIHLLMLNPESESLPHFTNGLAVSSQEFKNECQLSMDRYLSLASQWKAWGGDPMMLEARLTPNMVRIRAYVVDPGVPTSVGFYFPTVNQQSTTHGPAFECVHVPGGVGLHYFEGLKREFEEKGVPVKEFLERHPGYASGGQQKTKGA